MVLKQPPGERSRYGVWREEDREDYRKQFTHQAQEAYEKRMTNRYDRHDKNVLCIDAYEKLLSDKRELEKKLLNAKRNREYEKNRPPADKWYEMKHNEKETEEMPARFFWQECYRNNVALKPNNQNSIYLDRLRDKAIY